MPLVKELVFGVIIKISLLRIIILKMHLTLMGELNRKIISTTQEADCTYHERRLLHHILHNRDYTIEGAAASLGLREAEVRIILESLQHRGLTQ